MAWGRLCRRCRGGQCVDRPTPLEPVEIECAVCHGDGCAECHDGAIEITECPSRVIGQETPRLVQLVRLYAKGLPPVAGGTLDQAAQFVDLADFWFAEDAAHRQELGLP